MKKTLKYVIIVSLTLLCLVGSLAGCTKKGTPVDAQIILVLEDKTEIKYDLTVASGTTLRNALYDAKLIGEADKDDYFVQTIDGHTASAEEGVLWMISKTIDGASLGTFDDVKIKNPGTVIYLVYTVAPYFDD